MQGIRRTPVCGWMRDIICLSLLHPTSSCSGHWAKSNDALLAPSEKSAGRDGWQHTPPLSNTNYCGAEYVLDLWSKETLYVSLSFKYDSYIYGHIDLVFSFIFPPRLLWLTLKRYLSHNARRVGNKTLMSEWNDLSRGHKPHNLGT